MHFVGRVDWSFADEPAPETATSAGLARRVLVGAEQGAVHTELAVGCAGARRLARAARPLVRGGALPARGPARPRDRRPRPPPRGRRLRAHPDRDPAHPRRAARPLGPLAVRSTLRRAGRPMPPGSPTRCSRSGAARRRRAGRPGGAAGRRPGRSDAPIRRPLRGHAAPGGGVAPHGACARPAARRHGHRAPRVQRHLGEDARRQARWGRTMLTMFTVDYEVGGAAQAHDHPFEETYFFLGGEVEAELDGIAYTLVPGDVVFAGVAKRARLLERGHRSGCAGSRPRRRSRRRAARIAGSRHGSGWPHAGWSAGQTDEGTSRAVRARDRPWE